MAKILIIEDSKSQAAIIAEIVQNAGHEPRVCSEVTSTVLQTARSFAPSLVLLDLVLLGPDGKPTADGFQLCREIKRALPKVKVVVVSAQGDDDSSEWALMQGADGFLQKPFTMEDLVGMINEVLA